MVYGICSALAWLYTQTAQRWALRNQVAVWIVWVYWVSFWVIGTEMNVAFSARVQALGNNFEYASIGETMDLHLTVIGTPVIEIAFKTIQNNLK